MFCPLAELSFLPLACACITQCAFVISVWQVLKETHGSACSLHHSTARLRSPQRALLLLLLHSHPAMPVPMAAVPLLRQQHIPGGKGAANHKPH